MSQLSSQQRLAELHEQTDRRFSITTGALPASIGCGTGCSSCCVDELTVWQPEAERIAAWVAATGHGVQPHPAGRCAFLKDGRCQVYPARPYVCRSQGAVLRFWDEEGERRDTCPEHLQALELSILPQGALFDLGPAEQELASIATAELAERGGRGLPERVALRSLALSLRSR